MAGGDADASGAGLVGRGPECAAIDALLERATRGESGSVVVRGEAGLGKTALLRYAVNRARGARVLRVTGVEAESELTFAGLHGLVWPIVDELERLPEPQHDALAAALGLAPGEGRERFLVSAGVLSLLASAAEASPVLCVVDDAQWLDEPSADSLVFTARRLVAEGIVILFGAREGEPRRFEAPGVPELVLSGLDRESAATLLAGSARRAVASVRERLLTEADGNPLALLELPVGLSGAQLAGREALPEALPLTERLRAAFAHRLDRLPESTRIALLVAAAADGAADLTVTVRAAAELELPEEALDPAEEAGLVQIRGGRVGFRHPLVRSTVYDSAPLGRRQRVHATLADVLAQRQPDRALWHRAMAAPVADESIAAALEASARRSQLRGGHASAASAFERAATLSEDGPSRGRRLAAAAGAAWSAGQGDRARDLAGRALPLLADRAQRAQLLYLRGVIEGWSGWLLDGVAALQQAIALSEDPSLTLSIVRDAFAMAYWAADYDAALALGRPVAGLPQATDSDRFNAAAVLVPVAELSDDHAGAERLAAEAIELGERLDDPLCLIWAALTAARQGRSGAALPFATRAVDVARTRGLISVLPFALPVQGMQLVAHSRFELAYAAGEEGRRLAVELGQPWAAGWNLAQLTAVDAVRGDEESAYAHVAELRALLASSGATLVGHYVEWALGLLELGQGRPADALERLLVVVRAVRPESNPLFLFGLPDAVEAAVRADRPEEVSAHLHRYEAWVERVPTAQRLALLARCRALMDEPDADRHFSRALALADALSPFERARTELLYGEWLRRQRRRIDARRPLRAALELFGQLSVAPWEARARAELRASGETARRRDSSTGDQLTPQELQIARLVAGGLTNPDVAAQLFLSPRTIDYHLRKVFAKLEIASRTDLADVNLGEPAIA